MFNLPSTDSDSGFSLFAADSSTVSYTSTKFDKHLSNQFEGIKERLSFIPPM